MIHKGKGNLQNGKKQAQIVYLIIWYQVNNQNI